MARKAKELSALEVGRLVSPGLHAVGGVAGLSLQISQAGARSWILRVMVGGKRREMGLGGFPDVTLAGARDAARAARLKLTEGIDPVADAQAKRSALIAARASALSFEEAARRYIGTMEAEWKNAKHGDQWRNTLATYASPIIGKILVREITQAHILQVLEPIWLKKTETATRVRSRIENVLDWARVRGYREGENPARWRGHLEVLLQSPNKVQKVKHHPALPWGQMGAFMGALKAQAGMGARALEFAILTAARSGEVRGATWNEINDDDATWTIPAGRMKASKEHSIPLNAEAVAILEALPKTCDLIFPNSKETPLSDMTLTATIRRMDEAILIEGGKGWKDASGATITAHGFRSTFRDWAGETTAYAREVIEHALAHQLADKAEAAYARGTLYTKRRRLMADWGRYATKTAAGSSAVVAINSRAA